MAERVQLRRTPGFRKPEGAIVVARPSQWGNPFPVKGDWIMWTAIALGYRGDAAGRRRAAVELHRAWLTDRLLVGEAFRDDGSAIEFSNGVTVSMDEHCRGLARGFAGMVGGPRLPERPPIAPLTGRDLACWCPLDQPCHADVLLEIAGDIDG